ncbi:MAG: AIPR family protein, partial [Coleofasciculus sp. C2-GNP5-27]
NVRDWQDYNAVNGEIRSTLQSPNRERFVLMNNGVTIIARKLNRISGSRFSIEDFQIVNGCQTSNVIFDQRGPNLDKVYIPLRLIQSQDETVIESIIRATNRQTELKAEQLYALTVFSKKLEAYFSSVTEANKLYYERRDCQYDRFPGIERTKIVVPQTLIRAFGAMFLGEPTRVTRNYKAFIKEYVGVKMLRETDRLEPYYVAAFAAYRLEFLFRNKKLGSEYKAARYHILAALRYLINSKPLPAMNSYQMETRCKEITDQLWDQSKAETLINAAAQVIRDIVGDPFDRDHIRTEPVKEKLVAHFKSRESA